MPEWLLALDGGLLLWLQEWVRSGFLTPLLTFYTHLGDHGLVWIVLCAVLLCFKRTRKAGLAGLLALLLHLPGNFLRLLLGQLALPVRKGKL